MNELWERIWEIIPSKIGESKVMGTKGLKVNQVVMRMMEQIGTQFEQVEFGSDDRENWFEAVVANQIVSITNSKGMADLNVMWQGVVTHFEKKACGYRMIKVNLNKKD